MGRDAAQIRREIDLTRGDLANTITAIRTTDVKAVVDDARAVAVTRAKVKAQALQPVLRARVEAKVRELQPAARDRAQAPSASTR